MTWKELSDLDSKLREEQVKLQETDKPGEFTPDKDDVVQMWPPEHWLELPSQPGETGVPGDLNDLKDAIGKVKANPKSKEAYTKLVELAKARGVHLKSEILKCAEQLGLVDAPVGGGEEELKPEEMKVIEEQIATKIKESFKELREEIGLPTAPPMPPAAPVAGAAPPIPPPNPMQMMKSMREELDGLKGEWKTKGASLDGYGKALDEMNKRIEALGPGGLKVEEAQRLREFLAVLSPTKLKEMSLGQPGGVLATGDQVKDGADPAGMHQNEGEPNSDVRSFGERMNRLRGTPSTKKS